MIRVVVAGAGGRMGRSACEAVEASDDMELVARVGRGDDLAAVLGSGAERSADVLVELSVPEAAPQHVRTAVSAGVHAVVGTTGWDEHRLTAVRQQLGSSPGTGVLIAPNFSLGALVVGELAVRAARFFESVEIVELHHPDKVDAPSGTAVRTAERIAAARQQAGLAPAPDATVDGLPGARGTDVAGVPVHSVRLRGLLAHQEILLGGPGEHVTLRHDSLDRGAFMPGLLLAIRSVRSHLGLTVGLEQWLDL